MLLYYAKRRLIPEFFDLVLIIERRLDILKWAYAQKGLVPCPALLGQIAIKKFDLEVSSCQKRLQFQPTEKL